MKRFYHTIIKLLAVLHVHWHEICHVSRYVNLILHILLFYFKQYIHFQSEMVSEIHALVSVAKPLMSFASRDAAQECREACGGHGFLKGARLGEIRNTVEPCLTYEGDNNVLMQQTSNWLLRQYQAVAAGEKFSSPLGSCSFFSDFKTIKNLRSNVRSVSEVQVKECKWFKTFKFISKYLYFLKLALMICRFVLCMAESIFRLIYFEFDILFGLSVIERCWSLKLVFKDFFVCLSYN